MFEVRVEFPMDDDFELNDDRLKSIIGSSSFSGAGFGLRDHGFWRDEFHDALELKQTIREEFPTWNVTLREK